MNLSIASPLFISVILILRSKNLVVYSSTEPYCLSLASFSVASRIGLIGCQRSLTALVKSAQGVVEVGIVEVPK